MEPGKPAPEDDDADDVWKSIARKKAELDQLPPISREQIERIRRLQDIELTYTSLAIEGNSLTHEEVAGIIERDRASRQSAPGSPATEAGADVVETGETPVGLALNEAARPVRWRTG